MTLFLKSMMENLVILFSCEVDNISMRLIYQDLPCGFDRQFLCHGRTCEIVAKTGSYQMLHLPCSIQTLCFILLSFCFSMCIVLKDFLFYGMLCYLWIWIS